MKKIFKIKPKKIKAINQYFKQLENECKNPPILKGTLKKGKYDKLKEI